MCAVKVLPDKRIFFHTLFLLPMCVCRVYVDWSMHVHMYVDGSVCVWVSTCASLKLILISTFIALHFVYRGRVSFWTPSSWAFAQFAPGSSCHCLPSAGISGGCHDWSAFPWFWGSKFQSSCISSQYFIFWVIFSPTPSFLRQFLSSFLSGSLGLF